MPHIEPKRLPRYLVEIALLALIYHLVARLGLQMAYVQANTSPVWPPSGIALAALLLLGMGHWPGITLGVVVGSLLTGAPLPLALGLGLANTLEALVGAYLLQHWIGFHRSIDRIRDVVGLAACAAVSTAVSASLGVALLTIIGNESQAPFFTLWATWWVGNLLGVLVVTPFILTWVKFRVKKLQRSNWLEALTFIILLVSVTGYVFSTSQGTSVLHQALIYVIFPFAIWAALRLHQVGAVTTVFVVSDIAIWGTVHGMGPFSQLPLNESLILLQTFTGVVALTSLTLVASASERRNAEQALNRRVEDLAALNDASQEFLGNLDKTALYDSICRLVVERLGLSTAWIELTNPEGAVREITTAIAAIYPTEPANRQLVQKGFASPVFSQVIHSAQKTARIAILKRPDGGNLLHPSGELNHSPSVAAIPLIFGGKMIGFLGVTSERDDGFPKEQVLLLESYANLAVVAIQNSWLFDQVRLGNEQLHALSHRLMDIQEQERMHLSRELHDESGQILAALMVRLGLLERDAKSQELLGAHIVELKRIVTEVLNNLHTLAVNLRPASLDHLGLITALQQYIQEYMRQYPLQVQFDGMEIEATRLPPEVETAFYRIVQESLTNVALHAQANRVDILINRRNGCLVMTIEDDGVGFNPNPIADENRLGLFGMRERVEMLGGSFLVESSPGKGTIIVVEVPNGH
jgi:signal transduction histidine kinase